MYGGNGEESGGYRIEFLGFDVFLKFYNFLYFIYFIGNYLWYWNLIKIFIIFLK